MLDFGKFFDRLQYVKDWDSFWWFFNGLSGTMQFVVGAVIFGLLVLLWIFIVAIFIDKHA